MGNAAFLKQYLVALGIKDNFSEKLKEVLNKSSQEVKTFTKGFAVAGGAVASLFLAANAGIAKFATNLVKADDELTKYAKEIGKSKDEAFKLKATLDVMGKTMEEIKDSEELTKVFNQLQKDAAAIKPPDLSDGLKQVKEIQTEFTRFKQAGSYAVQWIGHYLFKYLQQPMQKIKDVFSGLNDNVIKNMPKWSEKVASVMASVVKLGMTVIRGAKDIFNAVRKIFDMIPRELKIVGGALTALGFIIKRGPLGILITIITAAILLLEDFYTWLDGGDALLGGVWQWLYDIWKLLKDSGAIERFKESFKNALEFAKNKIIEVKDYIVEMYKKFKESGSIEKFIDLLKNIKDLFIQISKPVMTLGSKIITAFAGAGKDALDWFIAKGLPELIGFISNAVGFMAGLIQKLNDMGLAEPIIIGIVAAFAGLKAIDGITDSVKKLTGFIEGVNKAQKAVIRIQELKNAFGGLKTALNATKIAQEAHNLILMLSAARTGGLAAAQTALAGAEGSATIAQWALNTAMSANPIALIIIGIAALIAIVVLLVKNWGKVKEFFIGLWNKIKEIFSGIGAWFKEKFQAAKDAIFAVFSNIGNWFKEKFQAAKDAVTGTFSNIGGWFKGKFQDAKDKITGTFSNIGSWFKSKYEDIQNGAKNLPAFLGDKFKQAREKTEAAFGPAASWFKDKWNGIKDTFSESDSYFGRVFAAGMQAIQSVFGTIVDYFKTIWENIKLVFSVVKSVLSGDFKGAYEAITQIWENITGFFSRTIERIKSIFASIVNWFKDKASAIVGKFSNIPNDFKDKFFEAVNKIKEVFLPLVDWFKDKIDAIKGFFTGIGDKVKGVFSDSNDPKDKTLGHDNGGIFDKEHNAPFCEDDKLEAIVPLTKPKRAKEVISGAMNYLGIETPDKLSQKIDSLSQFAATVSGKLTSLSAGLNQSTSQLYTTTNQTVDNRSFDLHSDYKIYDTSGRPEATANAVDRTKQIQLRNLQGVLN